MPPLTAESLKKFRNIATYKSVRQDKDKTTQIILTGGSVGFNFSGVGPERSKTAKTIKEIFKGKRVFKFQ